ncbi:MAG: FtsW/RodA/SpoVE family cell cycle protein [Anaerolineae bacterium]
MLRRAILGGAPLLTSGAAVLVAETVLATLLCAYLVSGGAASPAMALLIFALPFAAAAASIIVGAREGHTAFASLPIAVALNLLGLVILAIVAPSFATLQGRWSLFSLAVYLGLALGVHRLEWLRRWAPWLCLVSLALLAATFVVGTHPTGQGARQWLAIGPAYFQPSEAVKVSVMLLLAVVLGERGRRGAPPIWWAVLPALAVLMLLAQGDLGAAVVVAMVAALMLLGAIGRWWWPLVGVVGGAGACLVAYEYLPRAQVRIDIWLHLWQDPYGASYQIVQSLRAIASAGIAGKGLLASDTLFIPALHTDMIMAAIGERLGVLGSISVIIFFVAMLAYARGVAATATTRTDALLCLGTAIMLVGQAFLILGGSTAMLPLTGVTLPFVSYGGSSLLVSYSVLGILEGRRRSGDMSGVAVGVRGWQQGIYLALAGAMMAVAVWLSIWHIYGAAILGPRLTAP